MQVEQEMGKGWQFEKKTSWLLVGPRGIQWDKREKQRGERDLVQARAMRGAMGRWARGDGIAHVASIGGEKKRKNIV